MTKHWHRTISLLCVAFVLSIAASVSVLADDSNTGATTHGGLVPGTRIVHVTSLADSGPGTLRSAVETRGPRVIVFDVGGRISLASDLAIREAQITIAGQTAPSPGITLAGGSLRIRTHDVVVQHIAVRPGPALSAAVNGNRDGISIDGNPNSKRPNPGSYQVLLENVSVSWSVDEGIDLWYKTTRHVTIRNSIVSEALNNAGHPKGQHSMGLLIGKDAGPAEVTGNLLANNRYRNPVIAKGATAFVANNYIVNPGQNAIHFYVIGGDNLIHATIVNNVIQAGPDSQWKLRGVLIPLDSNKMPTKDVIYVKGNQDIGFSGLQQLLGVPDNFTLASKPPVDSADWKLLPTDQVKAWVLKHAGTRPLDRDPVDTRLLAQISAGSERIINRPSDTPTVQQVSGTKAVAAVPNNPTAISPRTGKTKLDMWLCLKHLQLGGAQSQNCPESADELETDLKAMP
jgi:hypothetical protein